MKKKRRPCHVPHRPPPVIQVLPHMRCRIDPTIVPALSQWILALRDRYERIVQTPAGGLAPEARRQRAGLVSWARMMIRAYDDVLRSLHDTADLRAVERARAEWDAAVESHLSEPRGANAAQ